MGNQSNVKALRKSLRNVVQELLPSLLNTELSQALSRQLGEQLGKRMDFIAANAVETLAKIDERQKDFQNLVMRNITPPTVAKVENIDLTKTETPPPSTL